MSSSPSPLFRLANGSVLRVLSAKELVRIPVWKNNRIIDREHAAAIQRDVGAAVSTLDHGYHLAILAEEDAAGRMVDQQYIIDGQHRLQVLKTHFDTTLCAADFPVLVFERRFVSEGELIEHFNTINKSKPVQPWVDEPMILNNYVKAVELAFHSKRQILIRPGGCHRPYLSSDRLREALKTRFKSLPATQKGADAFAAAAKAWNDHAVATADVFVLGIRATKKREFFEKGAKIGFVLACDDRFAWVDEVLRTINSSTNTSTNATN